MIASSDRIVHAFDRLKELERDERPRPVRADELGMRPELWAELVDAGLVEISGGVVRLTEAGRTAHVHTDPSVRWARSSQRRREATASEAEVRDRLIHGGPR